MREPIVSRSEISATVKVEPNDPPWNSWIAIVVWLASVALVVVVPSVIVLIYVATKPELFGDQATLLEFIKTDATAVFLQVAALLPVHLATLALSWAVVTRLRTFSFSETLGWQSGGMQWWHYILILAGFIIIAGVVSNYFPEADNEVIRIIRSSRAAVFALALLATFTAPIVEEVVYRGILFSALQRTFGPVAAIAAVTGLFAIVHFPQYWPSYSTLIMLTMLSLILTLIRARTGNLLPCIILHTIFNGVQSIVLVAEPYISAPPPVDQGPLVGAILDLLY